VAALSIPKSPDALSADWLTSALCNGGLAGIPTVTSFEYEPIAEGVGFLGKLGRLRLNYAGAAAGAPLTLIAKLPTEDEKSRQLAMAFRFYEREVSFYQEIGSRAGIRVPTLHYGAADPSNGDFVLLLEDLAPARVGDQLQGCTGDQARVAIKAIAECHASWWQSPRLESLAWLPTTNDPIHHFAQPAFQQCWAPFVQFVGDKLSPAMKRTGEALATKIILMLDGLADMPKTLVHGDYRADNLFFGGTEDGSALAVVDWQVSSRGGGTFDVGYFLAGNVSPQVRRAHEMDLLQLYVRTLKEHGVQNFNLDDCLEAYRFATLYCLVYAVIVIGTLDTTNARGVSLFHTAAERVVTAIADLDAAAVMPR
jgi:aminoglycoside/choline kinase family phosphotransferase